MKFKNVFILIPCMSAILLSSTANASVLQDETVDFRILGTTDVHANILAYDYYTDKPSKKIGLVRTATLIKRAREENTNSVLVDNGDLIQGAPLGDYIFERGLNTGEIHPIYQVMNKMGYDAAVLGNHEFNYGLDFMKKSISGANFPYILSNALDAKTGEPAFNPYLIKDVKVRTESGKNAVIQVGYIGFTTPQITIWDKEHLEGKIITTDIVDTAAKLVPEMKAKGVDVVIAIAHSGISEEPRTDKIQNSVKYLSEVEGIDAIVFGHQHYKFPSSDYQAFPNVDLGKGTINGVPSVMAGAMGAYLGVIDLKLSGSGDDWSVIDGNAQLRGVYDNKNKQALVEEDTKLVETMKPYHEGTRAIVGAHIGVSDTNITSYLSLLQNTSSIQVINDAQTYYVEKYIKAERPDLVHLPVISAIAPYKTGNRNKDSENYVDIAKGTLTFRNAVDLYPFGNTLSVLKSSGEEIKEWLEASASIYNQINVEATEPQDLVNVSDFHPFNYDIFSGLTYEIDVTKPARYNNKGELVNKRAERIKNLKYHGKPVLPSQEFIVASNSHRAHAGIYAGTGDEKTIYSSTDESRAVIAMYMKAMTNKSKAVAIDAVNNWNFTPIDSTNRDLDIRFYTSDSKKADMVVKNTSHYLMQKVGKTESGFAVYKVKL